jgi:type IV pilus assembly protein PilO
MALDFDDLKKLPPMLKALIIGLVYLVLGYLYFILFLQGALDRHSALSAKLTDLRQQIAEKEKTVAQMDRYIREVNEVKEAFKTALLKLPNEKEIPELLASIAAAGRSAGVDFITFEPKLPERKPPETVQTAPKPAAPGAAPPKPGDAKGQPTKPAAPEKFYEDIPVKVQLTGGFHNTLSFFDQAARLPRIVNIEDIAMTDAQEVKGRGRVLKTSCTMKTYMFVDIKK